MFRYAILCLRFLYGAVSNILHGEFQHGAFPPSASTIDVVSRGNSTSLVAKPRRKGRTGNAVRDKSG